MFEEYFSKYREASRFWERMLEAEEKGKLEDFMDYFSGFSSAWVQIFYYFKSDCEKKKRLDVFQSIKDRINNDYRSKKIWDIRTKNTHKDPKSLIPLVEQQFNFIEPLKGDLKNGKYSKTIMLEENGNFLKMKENFPHVVKLKFKDQVHQDMGVVNICAFALGFAKAFIEDISKVDPKFNR